MNRPCRPWFALWLTPSPACSVARALPQLDGFVISRSAFNHSVNYRSVVVLGKAELVRCARGAKQSRPALLAERPVAVLVCTPVGRSPPLHHAIPSPHTRGHNPTQRRGREERGTEVVRGGPDPRAMGRNPATHQGVLCLLRLRGRVCSTVRSPAHRDQWDGGRHGSLGSSAFASMLTLARATVVCCAPLPLTRRKSRQPR